MKPSSVLRLALLALLWGSSFLWIKVALRTFSPVQITFGRLVLGSAVLGLVVWLQRARLRLSRALVGHLVVAAVIANAIPYTLFGIAEQTVSSNVAGVLNATTPLWTVSLAVALGTDRTVSLRRAAGLALGFGGTLVIFEPWSAAGTIASWGGLACLLAAISYAVSYLYMSRFLASRGIPPLLLSAAQLTVATALVAIALPIGGPAPSSWHFDAIASVGILGAFGTAVAYVLNYRLLADEGPVPASTVTYLLPIVAIILGLLALREPVTITMVIGIVLVLLGVALSQRRAPRPT